jgi:hypothetical protein
MLWSYPESVANICRRVIIIVIHDDFDSGERKNVIVSAIVR